MGCFVFFFFSKLNATVLKNFSFKDGWNIVLCDVLKKFPLTKDSQKQHPVNFSQDGQPNTFSLPQRIKTVFLQEKMVGPPALHHFHCYILSTDDCVLCFVHCSSFMFHSSKHCIWLCSLPRSWDPPMQKETQCIKGLNFYLPQLVRQSAKYGKIPKIFLCRGVLLYSEHVSAFRTLKTFNKELQ